MPINSCPHTQWSQLHNMKTSDLWECDACKMLMQATVTDEDADALSGVLGGETIVLTREGKRTS